MQFQTVQLLDGHLITNLVIYKDLKSEVYASLFY